VSRRRGTVVQNHVRRWMDMNQQVFPHDFWSQFVKSMISNLRKPTGKHLRALSQAIEAIERFPRRTRLKTQLMLQLQQQSSRRWTIEICVDPSQLSLSAHEIETDYDGNWSALDYFQASWTAVSSPPKGTAPQVDMPDASKVNRMCAQLTEIFSKSDKWSGTVFFYDGEEDCYCAVTHDQ
jgi:hypothetical protein